jgi:hypothetical protein
MWSASISCTVDAMSSMASFFEQFIVKETTFSHVVAIADYKKEKA